MRCDRYAPIAALIAVALSVGGHAQQTAPEVLTYGKKYVMGTVFEIAAYDRSSQHATDAIQRALEEVARVDDLLSNYKPESALSKLNRSAHFNREKVPADLYFVIEQAVQYSRLSDGKFDMTVAPWVNLWKAALSGDSLPSREEQERVRSCIGYEKIELTPPDQIAFRSSCMELDPGAIGKGYAVDRAAQVLRAWGIHNALINAGGSTILAMGSPPGERGWLVHLRDPSQQVDPQIILKDQSLSTSEQTAPTLLGKDSAGHIIDPDTGMPLRTDVAVSVIADAGIRSDALSTSLLLLGPKRGRNLVNRLKDVSAVWISPQGKTEIARGGPQIQFARGAAATQHGNLP
jgi:thiamine biosynthesis lipoprotein